jgi:hypothetical protein
VHCPLQGHQAGIESDGSAPWWANMGLVNMGLVNMGLVNMGLANMEPVNMGLQVCRIVRASLRPGSDPAVSFRHRGPCAPVAITRFDLAVRPGSTLSG